MDYYLLTDMTAQIGYELAAAGAETFRIEETMRRVLAAYGIVCETFAIPNCVMGGVCLTLYGFIAVSGLKMCQDVDLNDNRNLFVVSAILIAGVGGLTLTFGKVTITSVACALILGILVNVVVRRKDHPEGQEHEPQQVIK